MPPFAELAKALTRYRRHGLPRQLAEVLEPLIEPENRAEVYPRIGRALVLADRILKERRIKYDQSRFSDPLTIVTVLSELASKQNRHPEKVDETTILAAILYPTLRLIRASRNDDPDLSHAPIIARALQDIHTELGNDVGRLIQKTLQVSEINPPSTHTDFIFGSREQRDGHDQNFLHMVAESVGSDPRAILIRGAQWLVFMRNVEERRHNECLHLTERDYIPLTAAYGYDTLKERMQDQLLQMRDPAAYREIEAEVTEIENGFLASIGKGHVTDRTARQRIICDLIEDRILLALPTHLRDACVIETRPKTPYSIHRKKLEQKSGKDRKLDDVFAARIIISAPETDREYDVHNERVLCAETVRSLKRTLLLVPDSEDDYMGTPDKGGEKHKSSGRGTKGAKSNGYEAIHCTFYLGNKAEFEIQVTGQRMHYNNQYGTAAHSKYKGFSAADVESAQNTVSVFGPGNDIITLPRGASAADYLATYGADVAFRADDLEIGRLTHYFDPHLNQPGTGFSSPLITGDRITFAMNANAHHASHRRDLIDACALPETRAILQARHEELCAEEGTSVATRGNFPHRGVLSLTNDGPGA